MNISLLLAMLAGCTDRGEFVSRGPDGTHSVERQSRELIQQLESLVQQEDAVHAQLVRERLQSRSWASFGKEAKPMAEVNRLLDRQLVEQEITVTHSYIWAKKPPTNGPEWRKALDRAQRHFDRHSKGNTGSSTGVAVLRVHVENPELEERIGAQPLKLNHYSTRDDGHGVYDYPTSGGFILLGKPGASGPVGGEIQFESLRHEPVTLPIEVPAGEVVCAGEVLLRRAEYGNLGNLEIRVLPEEGILLQDAVVRVGRRYAHWTGGYPVQPDGICLIEDIAAGPCQVYVEVPNRARGMRREATVGAGATTRLELPLHARRQVTIDWKYRLPPGQGSWQEGTTTMLTGEPAPLNLWEQNGSVYRLGDWNGNTAEIRGMNGLLLPTDPQDFEAGRISQPVELFRSQGRSKHEISEGQIFAIRYGHASRGGNGEALIRIRSIKSSLQ